MSTRDYPLAGTPELLVAALERANDAVVIVDGDRHVSYFNAAAELVWGLDRTEVLGGHVDRLGLKELGKELGKELVKDPGPDVATPASDQVNGGAAIAAPGLEVRITRKDGSRLRAALSLSRVDVGGQQRTIAFVRDITAEVEQRERVALLNAVADRTSRAVVVTDHELRIIYVNAAFTALFGYSLEETQGRRANALMVGRHTNRRTLAKLRHWIGEESGGEEEILAYDKNGGEVWISTNVKAFRDGRGRIKQMFALLSDISETKQLRSLQQLIMSALADELDITDIADRLCRRVEEIAPDVVSSLRHIDAGGLIHPLGSPSLPEDYSRALDGVAIGPDIGSCGSSAFYGKAALAVDIDTDPRWQLFKQRPLEVGLRACWSTPIKGKDGRVIGTFAFYFRECRPPSRWHQRIVDACVHLGALAIERQEARAQIARLAY